MTETKTKHYVRTAPCIRIIYSESKIHIYNGLKKKGIQKLKIKLEDKSKCKNNICENEKYRKGMYQLRIISIRNRKIYVKMIIKMEIKLNYYDKILTYWMLSFPK